MKCKYCGGHMSLAWPSDAKMGAIMNCDRCKATCQSDGKKTWDWRKGGSDAG